MSAIDDPVAAFRPDRLERVVTPRLLLRHQLGRLALGEDLEAY